MSDGEPTDSEGTPAILALTEEIRNRGWCIMTVGFGSGGARARSILSGMAGEDACAVFLYAADGELATAFGTVHQLLADADDLAVHIRNPFFLSLGSRATVSVRVTSPDGKPVPGGKTICAPEATVRASTAGTSEVLLFEGDSYTTELLLKPGLNRITVIASLVSSDRPEAPFVGSASRTVLALPLWVAFTVPAIVVFVIVLSVVLIRTRVSSRTDEKLTNTRRGK
jgi:hypothetical protein